MKAIIKIIFPHQQIIFKQMINKRKRKITCFKRSRKCNQSEKTLLKLFNNLISIIMRRLNLKLTKKVRKNPNKKAEAT